MAATIPMTAIGLKPSLERDGSDVTAGGACGNVDVVAGKPDGDATGAMVKTSERYLG